MPVRQKIEFLSKTFVKQHSQFYCGLACLASVVKYYGGETTQEKLRETSGTTINGTSLLGLYQSAQKLGFETSGYEAGINDLKEQDTPVILHVVKDEKQEHFVVCYGFEDGRFTIGDPGWGITQYSIEELDAIWKSKALLKLLPGKNFITKKTESGNKRKWFFKLIKSDYPLLTIAALLGMLISILGLATAIFSQKLIDHILPDKNISTLVAGLIIFAFILLARSLLTYIRSVFLVRQSKEMNTRLVAHFFSKLLFLPTPFFDSTSTGDMVARMNDAARIQKVVVYLSSQILIDILIIITSAAYIFFYSISTGIISLLSIPLFGYLAWHYNSKVIEGQREVMEGYALTESKYIDTINGIKTIKNFRREYLFSKTINTIYDLFMQKVYTLGLLGTCINFWVSIGSGLLLIGVIAWCSFLVLEERMLLGQMMAIISLVGSVGASVISVAMANIINFHKWPKS